MVVVALLRLFLVVFLPSSSSSNLHNLLLTLRPIVEQLCGTYVVLHPLRVRMAGTRKTTSVLAASTIACPIWVHGSRLRRLFLRRGFRVHLLSSPWQLQAQHTAVPTNLLGSSFLSKAYEFHLPKATHAIWHEIIAPTEGKYMIWLERASGRFQRKVSETLSRGRAPNTRNFGSMYRDAEPEVVYKMCCLWAWLLPHMAAAHTPRRIEQLTEMFYTGPPPSMCHAKFSQASGRCRQLFPVPILQVVSRCKRLLA